MAQCFYYHFYDTHKTHHCQQFSATISRTRHFAETRATEKALCSTSNKKRHSGLTNRTHTYLGAETRNGQIWRCECEFSPLFPRVNKVSFSCHPLQVFKRWWGVVRSVVVSTVPPLPRGDCGHWARPLVAAVIVPCLVHIMNARVLMLLV